MGAGARASVSSTSIADTKSAELYHRATSVLPGGVNSPVRAMQAIGRDPLFIERGDGAEIIDVDGNRYVDWVCSWGPLIHGHAHPEIVEAVIEAARMGTSFGAPTAGEVELAEEVARRMTSVHMLRMISSGTEATMSAVRLARAATGRDEAAQVLRRLPRPRRRPARRGRLGPGHPGPALLARRARRRSRPTRSSCPGTTPRRSTAATAEHELAAIIAEPFAANMGLVPAESGFLELLRELATATGALLLFDEVITGFRVDRGGVQELAGVSPDLTIMGKILGGGLPAAAYGGSRDLMEQVAPAGAVYQAGTLSGNPLAVAAGLASLRLLDELAYTQLAATTEQLAEGLREAAGDRPVQIVSAPGLLTVFFSAAPVRDYAGARACDLDAYGAWCRALLARGVYAPPSQFEAWFPSLAHEPEHVTRTVEAAAAAFAAL